MGISKNELHVIANLKYSDCEESWKESCCKKTFNMHHARNPL